MSLSHSPERLHALAGEMDDVAAQVRELAGDLVAVREEIGWVSAAAEQYQASLAERAADTQTGATHVEEVAAALRSHAEGVAGTFALIDAARTFLVSAAEEARSVLAGFWDGVVDFFTPDMEDAQRVLDLLAEAPVADVHLDWLDRAGQAGWRG